MKSKMISRRDARRLVRERRRLVREKVQVEAKVKDYVQQSEITDIEALQKENDKIKLNRKCKMCEIKEANILFLPCCDIAVCKDCYMPVFKEVNGKKLPKCVQCQRNVVGIVSVYFC